MADPRTAGGLLLVAVVVSVSAVAIALAWPAAAETVLRLLLVVLAAGAVARSLVGVGWPAASDLAASPLRTADGGTGDRQLPVGLRNLADQLSADVRADPAGAIPYSVRSTVRDELCRRLADNHGLDPRVPGHVRRIQALVSPPAWALIQPPPAARRYHRQPPVPMCYLDRILDDLERL